MLFRSGGQGADGHRGLPARLRAARRNRPAVTRYRIIVEYDGAGFVGWQRQANGPSVQAALEEAIHRFCGETVLVEGAGRTDSGVHALGQVAHFDLAKETTVETVMKAVNFHLKPAPVAVLSAAAVADDFHARFSAIRRAYPSRLATPRAPRALERAPGWLLPHPPQPEPKPRT